MAVYFTSDLHLGHKNITRFRQEFSTPEKHDEYIFSQLEKLNKRDILFNLGDFLFDGPHYDDYIKRLSELPVRMKLVLGNHDSLKVYNEEIFEIQLPLFSYKNMWISHPPIHPMEIRRRHGNIHGHIHGVQNKDLLQDKRYFNVNIDVNDYQIVPLENIKEQFGI